MGRPASPNLPVRGGDRPALSVEKMVFPQGLGIEARQADRLKKAKVAIARKIALILHCVWVDGTSIDWGQPKQA